MRAIAKARTAASTQRRTAGFRLVVLAACAGAFLLLPASSALANGTVDVDVTGTGSGTVTSSSETLSFGFPVGAAIATPGEIDCDRAGGPTCKASFAASLGNEVRVTLTAAPEPGDGPFAGWIQSGASSVASGCTHPAGSPETCVVNLNGTPGPTSKVTAIFGDPPPSPAVTTGASGAGAESWLTTLQGTVDPDGFAVTDCYFEYGTTIAYGATTPCEQSESDIGKGAAPVAVSASTEPLEPETTYHYRLVASSEIGEGIGGVALGEDQTFTTGAFVDECSDEESRERRAEQGIVALLLPDCMALEMVSPPVKNAHAAKEPNVSADGERVKFVSGAALGGTPGVLGFAGNPYIATRGASGWSTAPTVPPTPMTDGWSPNAEAKSLTPDFSRWFQLASTDAQAQVGIGQVFRGALGGLFEPLSPLLVSQGGGAGPEVLRRSKPQGVSTDHSHLVFSAGGDEVGAASTTLLPQDPVPAPNSSGSVADSNVYLAKLGSAGEPSLELLARGRDASDGKFKVFGGNCGARVGGVGGEGVGKRNQGAVSADGSRVLFSTRPAQPSTGDCSAANGMRILERVESDKGPVIAELFKTECDRVAPTCVAAASDNDLYQGASVDQTKVYFTTTRQLADTDLDALLDLYLYDSSEPLGQRLIQVSAGENVPGKHEAGKEAKVQNGTVAISGDGSHVYFVAEGVLTGDPSPGGKKASEFAATAPKLYLYQRDAEHPDGELSFIGALDGGDKGKLNLWGGEGTFRNGAYPVPATGEDSERVEVGGDGHVLVFLSRTPLTADDTDGAGRDVYRYDAEADQLLRVSKATPGGVDNGAFDVAERGEDLDPAGTDFAEVGRWASEDGGTVVFRTAEALVLGDVNGISDSYLWREGELLRLPGSARRLDDLANRPTLSHDGSTVAFQAAPKLLPEDGDSSADIYVARVEGGFQSSPAVVPCQPDASLPGPHCRSESSPAPDAPNSASAAFVGPGNQEPKSRPCPKGKRRVMRRGEPRCVKRPRRNAKRANQAKRKRHADTDRRAGK